MKNTILLFAITLSLLSVGSCKCNTKKDNVQTAVESVQKCPVDTKTSDSFYGTYTGTLPAADCAGIQTTLILNEDTTYDLTSVYLTETPQEFKTSGVYEREGEQMIVLITPSSGEKTYYKILENAVALVNANGEMAEGDLAELYILKKN